MINAKWLLLLNALILVLTIGCKKNECQYTVCPPPQTVAEYKELGFKVIPPDSEGVVDLRKQVNDTLITIRLWEDLDIPYVSCKSFALANTDISIDSLLQSIYTNCIVSGLKLSNNLDSTWVVYNRLDMRLQMATIDHGNVQVCYRIN